MTSCNCDCEIIDTKYLEKVLWLNLSGLIFEITSRYRDQLLDKGTNLNELDEIIIQVGHG